MLARESQAISEDQKHRVYVVTTDQKSITKIPGKCQHTQKLVIHESQEKPGEKNEKYFELYVHENTVYQNQEDASKTPVK